MNIENKKIYNVYHERKGKFKMYIESQDEEFAHGVILKGTAKANMDYNKKIKGDKISIRKSFCIFKEVLK